MKRGKEMATAEAVQTAKGVCLMRFNDSGALNKESPSPINLVYYLFSLMSRGAKLDLISHLAPQLIIEVSYCGKRFEYLKIFCWDKKIIRFIRERVIDDPLRLGEIPEQAVVRAFGLENAVARLESGTISVGELLLTLNQAVDWSRLIV